MKRKNLFLIPALFLTVLFCLFSTSCSSGYEQKGEITVKFSEEMLRKLGSYKAGSVNANGFLESEAGGFLELAETIGQEPMYVLPGTANDEVYVLMIYENGSYIVFSWEGIQKLNGMDAVYSGELPDDFSQYFQQEEYAILLSFFDLDSGNIISKGNWIMEDTKDSVSISENGYYDFSTGKWVELSEPSIIGSLLRSENSFKVTSSSGLNISFFNPEKYIVLVVELKTAGKIYDKFIFINMQTNKESSAFVTFDELTAGEMAMVSASVYRGDEIIAYGETEEFVIKGGENRVPLKLSLGQAFEELLPPSGLPVDVMPGYSESTEKNYLLALYEDNEYAVFEVEENIFDLMNVSDSIDYSAFYSLFENSLVVSFGTYSWNDDLFSYTEKAYYDKDSEKYKQSEYGGSCSYSERFFVASASGLIVTFMSGENSDRIPVYSGYGNVPEEYLDMFNGGMFYFNAYPDYSYEITFDTYDSNIEGENRLFAKGTWVLSESPEKGQSLQLTETEYLDLDSGSLVEGQNLNNSVSLTSPIFIYTGACGLELEFNLYNAFANFQVKLQFRFSDENGEYIENERFPDITLSPEQSDSYYEIVESYCKQISGDGYILNTEKTTDEAETDENGLIVYTYYFDRSDTTQSDGI